MPVPGFFLPHKNGPSVNSGARRSFSDRSAYFQSAVSPVSNRPVNPAFHAASVVFSLQQRRKGIAKKLMRFAQAAALVER
ncbi:MAG: hypothetical protein QOF48_1323 [Verrucomicrobiota bacterium]